MIRHRTHVSIHSRFLVVAALVIALLAVLSPVADAQEDPVDPPVEQPVAEEPTADEAPDEEPPADEPPAEEPPAEEPPAEDPPAVEALVEAPAAAAPAVVAAFVSTSPVFINEIHYDNDGADFGEVVEIAGPAGTDMTGWTIELYNGSNGAVYDTVLLNATISDQDDGYGVLAWTPSSIQNGSPDGLALVDDTGTLIEFLSYEGTFVGVGGAADGVQSTDIGVTEPGTTPLGQSLQRIGTGTMAMDFVWTGPAIWSVGDVNTGQDFVGGPVQPDLAITEIHYDNDGGDVGEFFEITGPAGTDLTGWDVVLYNGSNGTVYNTIDLTGTIDDEDGVSGAVDFQLPANGLQNGSPDGLALVDPNGSVVEFLSYEGEFNATDGPAIGTTSTDIGVSEPGSTPIGESLQLIGGIWMGPAANSAGVLNAPPAPAQPFISEIHYDNDGGDVGEFFEIEGPAGTDLTGWDVVLYNGSNGTVYNTIDLTGTIDDEDGVSGAVDFPVTGIQNGSPDGIALVDPDGVVVEFLSYEGEFNATDGPALGQTSTDIGVVEPGAVGQSLQLFNGVWVGPVTASPGMLNTEVVEPPQVVLIHDIQGSGTASPLVGQAVVISGIVVGDFQEITTAEPTDAPLLGYFVQEEDADADADPATSEGIFVYAPGGSAVSVGDLVEVTGTVTEFFDLTEIGNVTAATVISSGNTLPTPATPTVPTAPGDAPVDWEAIEGMSVSFAQPLYVTGMFPLGRYGELQLSAIGAQDHPNQTNAVGSAASVAQRQLNLDSRVILDDGEDENESFGGIDTWNPNPTPYLGGPDNTLRSGDVITNLAGVVHFSFDEYEVQPVNIVDPTDPDGAVNITRTPRPAAVPAVGGSLQVASFNVLNYFTTIDTGGATCGPPGNEQGCRGADTQAEFDLQSAKIATAIAELDADIVGVIELQNAGDDAAIADLVAKVNANPANPGRTYAYLPTGFIGTDAITVGYIYDTDTVAPEGAFAVLDSSVSPAFIDNKNRPVLAQTWTEFETEATLTTAIGHLKSKGSSCDDVNNPGDPAFGVLPYGAGVDVDDPNFQGNCNLTRLAAATVLGQWATNDPTGSPSDNVLLMGDLNAYQNEDPITELEEQGYTDLHAVDGTSWAESGHSYVFDGEHGTLDYLLANPALLSQVTGAAAWHLNADEPFAIDYQDFNPPGQAQPDAFKSSDHDPTIVGLDLTPPIPPGPLCNGLAATIVGTNGPDLLLGTTGDDVIVAQRGNDFVLGFGGNDTICLGDGRDWAFGGPGADVIFGEDGNDTIFGNGSDDVIDGGYGNDFIQGNNGNDTILGGDGNDWLFGRAGDDSIDGGPGNDLGDGGSGQDICTTIEFLFHCTQAVGNQE